MFITPFLFTHTSTTEIYTLSLHDALPAISRNMSAASAALTVSTPPWSRLEAKATIPKRDTRPYVGLMPVMPQSAAGCRIEPPVSVPVAPGTRRAATAAGEPPDEPPGTSCTFQGLRTGP